MVFLCSGHLNSFSIIFNRIAQICAFSKAFSRFQFEVQAALEDETARLRPRDDNGRICLADNFRPCVSTRELHMMTSIALADSCFCRSEPAA